MTSLSSSEAFLIFGKWRDNESQLQIVFFGFGKLVGSTPGVIKETSPNEESVAAFIVEKGQPAEWRVSLRGASFQYGEPLDSALYPELAEGKWASYLFVELPDGKSIFFAERFEGED